MANESRSIIQWVRTVKVGHGTLLAIIGGLVALGLLFHYTDLWYVLFP